jgi:DNA-binding NarL/FixJ family response regulator
MLIRNFAVDKHRHTKISAMKNIDTPIKVIITDDHALFRTGVKTSLASRRDIQMIGEAENGMQLLNLLKHMKPDVILLDISMPIMDGIATLPEIKKVDPEVKVIMLTMHNDHSMITKMMEIGANSYLTKDSDSETIYQAIRTCFDDEFYFNDLTNKALLKDLRSKKEPEPQVANTEIHLNEKETSILKLMCEEKSTREIAEAVDLSPRTVEAIRDKLKTKTGAKSLAGLIMYAVKAGIVEQK